MGADVGKAGAWRNPAPGRTRPGETRSLRGCVENEVYSFADSKQQRQVWGGGRGEGESRTRKERKKTAGRKRRRREDAGRRGKKRRKEKESGEENRQRRQERVGKISLAQEMYDDNVH